MSDRPTVGDVYVTPDGTRLIINRTARDRSWADIRVIQPHGAEWRKRQPLHDGNLPTAFEAVRIEDTTGGAA